MYSLKRSKASTISSTLPNLASTPPVECGTNAKLFYVVRMEKVLPSFDLESHHPHRKFDIVEGMLGGEGSDPLYW
jgi:hypothetical protein